MSVALATKGVIAPRGNISVEVVNLNLPLVSQINGIQPLIAKVTAIKTQEARIEIPLLSASLSFKQIFSAEVSSVNLKGVKNA